MSELESAAVAGLILLGVFTILLLITGAAEFHQRGMKRVRRGENK